MRWDEIELTKFFSKKIARFRYKTFLLRWPYKLWRNSKKLKEINIYIYIYIYCKGKMWWSLHIQLKKKKCVNNYEFLIYWFQVSKQLSDLHICTLKFEEVGAFFFIIDLFIRFEKISGLFIAINCWDIFILKNKSKKKKKKKNPTWTLHPTPNPTILPGGTCCYRWCTF